MDPVLPMPDTSAAAGIVVLAAGDYPCGAEAVALLRCSTNVVCCDGAAQEYMRQGGVPKAIVGDGDSLPGNVRSLFDGPIVADPDQETNDLTKAVNYCISRGETDITILGATGKREDHTLGNISLLAEYMDRCRVQMVTDYGVFDPIDCDTVFESEPGQQVSIITLRPGVQITTGNLRYPLTEALLPGWWQGTLNESLGDTFSIGTTGTAVVFRLFTRGRT